MPLPSSLSRPSALLIAAAIAAAPVSALAHPAKNGALSEIETAAIQKACENVSVQYTLYVDAKDYRNLPSVFAPDGVWEVLGKRMAGPEAISGYWKSRTDEWAPGYGRVHQLANQLIKVVDRDHATGSAIILVHMFTTPNSQKQSLAPNVLARTDDEYVRTDKGWKLKRRSISTLALEDARP